MIPDDLIKAAPALAKGAGAIAAAVPFTTVVKRMLGPAADEVAEMWRDQVRVYRYGRQLKLLEKAERMAKDAGFTPQAVPPKILFPLLEGASFEDDENLHTMWAALLANAALPDTAAKIRPSFIAILQQMDPREALVLSRIDEDNRIPVTSENEFRRSGLVYDPPLLIMEALKKSLSSKADADTDEMRFDDFLLSVDALIALQLIEKSYWIEEGDGVFSGFDSPPDQEKYTTTLTLTARGRAFVKACRPPNPRRDP